MKKSIMMLVASIMMSLSASAFTFDGVNITGNVQNVMREISARGYVFNGDKNWLEGSCQGTRICMAFNLTDVKQAGKIGQLYVIIPVEGGAEAIDALYNNAQTIFNVIYHHPSGEGNANVFIADPDGTTMTIEKNAEGLRLVYNTPYYKAK